MSKKLLVGALLVATLQTSCKVVNTHTFKVTGTPEINATEAHIETTKGHLYLLPENLSEKEIDLLKSLRPFQCLSVTTSEAFDMNSRTVRFREFRLKKLVEGDQECRKIKTTRRFSAQ
jgi:hypothetical protein